MQYLNNLKRITDTIEFKGIDILAQNDKSIKASILKLYANLYIKSFQGISDEKVTLQEIVEQERGVIIKGLPGAGKSTFIKYIVRKKIGEDFGFIPFIIQLEKLGNHFKGLEISTCSDAQEVLIDYILQDLKLNRVWIDKQHLENILANHIIWFLFDGFDEVRGDHEREQIAKLVNILYQYLNNCKFIITTRPFAIRESMFLHDFLVVNIDILHKSEIEEFINTLANIVDIDQKRIDAYGLINKLQNRQALYELAQTPVMLTFICIIYFTKGNIPENRLDIFREIISWLIKVKVKNEVSVEQEIQLLSFIAYKLSSSDLSMKEISKKELSTLIEKQLKALSYESTSYFRQIDEIGILIKQKNLRYTFWHYCFQEYLMAIYLCENIDNGEQIEDLVLNHWFDEDWQEIIILFSAQLLNTNRMRFILFIDSICSFLLKYDKKLMVKGASLLGLILKETYPEQTYLSHATKWNELKTKLNIVFSSVIPDVDPRDLYNAAIACGLCGDERLSSFDSTFIIIPAGSMFIGAQKNDPAKMNYDTRATEYEVPVKQVSLSEFEIRAYPITVAEYEQFIISGGYSFSMHIWTEEGYNWRVENKIDMPRNWIAQIYLRNTPVTGVSWYEAVAYCNWLTSEASGVYFYKLPSESQWEYGYRCCYPGCWEQYLPINCYPFVDLNKKTPIGMFAKSNSNGMTDMMGNVEEFCEDNWSYNHNDCPLDGTAFTIPHEDLIITKGGSTIRTIRLCRPTYRSQCLKKTRYDTIGFRVVRIKQR